MKYVRPPPMHAHARMLSVVACTKQPQAVPTQRALRAAHPLLLPLVLSGLLACAAGAARALTYLDPIGGGGGDPFDGGCPPDQNLSGFELRTGETVDAIRPVCVISLGPREIRVAPVQPPFFGGPGGGNRRLVCPPSSPIVIGLQVVASGRWTVTVAGIDLYCGQALLGAQPPYIGPQVFFHGPVSTLGGFYKQGEAPTFRTGNERCPKGQVAIGVHGTSGKWLDAIGLICDVPRLPRGMEQGVPPVKTLGRVGQDVSPVKALGRVEAPFDTPGSTRPICDVAAEARTRNNAAAPGLETQCRADLAARGEAIANRDPLSAELRRRAHNDLSRQGFDIGMAAAEGQTEPGPGKQAIHNALSGVEQAAFDAAVSFSIQRNRNAKLAATGAAIARADSAVAQARAADKDVFFWLGFDIATGIFGDRALGGLGNTVTAPASLAIRNALDPIAQRGFNTSTDFHLRRNGVTANLSGSAAASPPNGSKPVQLAAPLGGGAALNKAGALAPLQSNPLAGGASLKQAVIPAPGAARSPLQKADPAALNAQPQASPTTLPIQAPSALR